MVIKSWVVIGCEERNRLKIEKREIKFKCWIVWFKRNMWEIKKKNNIVKLLGLDEMRGYNLKML